MNLIDLTAAEKSALLDLAIIAMYTDAHLATAEDNRIHQLLVRLGVIDKTDRDTRYDESVTRIRQKSKTQAEILACAADLAKTFATPEKRSLALQTIETILNSDKKVTPQETQYLTAIRQALA